MNVAQLNVYLTINSRKKCDKILEKNYFFMYHLIYDLLQYATTSMCLHANATFETEVVKVYIRESRSASLAWRPWGGGFLSMYSKMDKINRGFKMLPTKIGIVCRITIELNQLLGILGRGAPIDAPFVICQIYMQSHFVAKYVWFNLHDCLFMTCAIRCPIL